MERKITDELLKWKKDTDKRPILLFGISGCGKTYSVLEFGKREYKNTIYFDCENNSELSYVVEKNNTLDKFIRGISALSLETILKEETLIVFDNVTIEVFNAVKKLFTLPLSYHIIMITNSSSFIDKKKLENLSVKKMNLVTFPEYLKFVGKEQLIDFIEDSYKNNKAMPFHSIATDMYNDYIITGGYPNAIVEFHNTSDYNLLNIIHDKNNKLFKYKLFMFDNLINIRRSIEIYDNMTMQLLKDNKKFLYGLLKTGARAKEYEPCINFMKDSGMIIKSTRINKISSPLSKAKDDDSFNLYFVDSGLLYKNMNISPNKLLTNNKLLEVLYENNIVTTLYQNGFNIYNYHSEGKAFIDIVIQNRSGKIILLEILHGDDNAKSKSLAITMNKFNIESAIRFGSENFSIKKGVKYIPYYAAFCITERSTL